MVASWGLRSDDKSWFGVHIGRARDVLPVGSGRDVGAGLGPALFGQPQGLPLRLCGNNCGSG
jgi:hypothetical protein